MRPGKYVDKSTETYEIDPSKFSKILSRVLSEKNLDSAHHFPTMTPAGEVSTLQPLILDNQESLTVDKRHMEDSTSLLNQRYIPGSVVSKQTPRRVYNPRPQNSMSNGNIYAVSQTKMLLNVVKNNNYTPQK
jgi:hypothetical protein